MTEKKLKGDVYYPSQEVLNYANGNWDELSKHATEDYEGFWAGMAEELHWFEKWDKVIDDSEKPFYKWYTGGKTNISYNCLDIHVKTHRRNKLALIWEGEDGEVQTYSYNKLHRETCKFANVLEKHGC
jgi:acetyl-CoA synthetase